MRTPRSCQVIDMLTLDHSRTTSSSLTNFSQTRLFSGNQRLEENRFKNID